MQFPRFALRFLFVLGLFSVLSTPSFAQALLPSADSVTQAGKGKGKKGDAPPRPRPKPGPQEGGDDD